MDKKENQKIEIIPSTFYGIKIKKVDTPSYFEGKKYVSFYLNKGTLWDALEKKPIKSPFNKSDTSYSINLDSGEEVIACAFSPGFFQFLIPAGDTIINCSKNIKIANFRIEDVNQSKIDYAFMDNVLNSSCKFNSENLTFNGAETILKIQDFSNKNIKNYNLKAKEIELDLSFSKTAEIINLDCQQCQLRLSCCDNIKRLNFKNIKNFYPENMDFDDISESVICTFDKDVVFNTAIWNDVYSVDFFKTFRAIHEQNSFIKKYEQIYLKDLCIVDKSTGTIEVLLSELKRKIRIATKKILEEHFKELKS